MAAVLSGSYDFSSARLEPGELAEAVLGVLREQEREQTAGAAPTEA